jgi:NADH-quinone oxidoreductase subunit L
MGTATAVALIVLTVTWMLYSKKANLPVADSAQTGLTRWIANKFYVDELYDALFVRPTERLSKAFHYYVDIQIIDGIVNGVGAGVQRLGAEFRKVQNGNIEYYLVGMVAGAAALMLTLWL